jgi:hypothetical protein
MSVLVMHDDSHANEDLLVRMRSAKSVQEEPCRPPLVSAASGGKRWHARKELTKSRSIYLGRFASRDAATKASTAAAGVAARPSTAEPARKAAWAATEDPEADELPAGLSMIPTLPSVQLLPRPQSARGVRELAFGRSFPASTEPFPAPAPHGHCQLWTVSEKPRLLLLREEPVEGDARSWFPPELLPATVARFTRVSLLEDGQVLCVAHKASGDAESAVLVASLPGSPARGSRSSRATTTEATSCVVESERSRPWSSRTAASASSSSASHASPLVAVLTTASPGGSFAWRLSPAGTMSSNGTPVEVPLLPTNPRVPLEEPAGSRRRQRAIQRKNALEGAIPAKDIPTYARWQSMAVMDARRGCAVIALARRSAGQLTAASVPQTVSLSDSASSLALRQCALLSRDDGGNWVAHNALGLPSWPVVETTKVRGSKASECVVLKGDRVSPDEVLLTCCAPLNPLQALALRML